MSIPSHPRNRKKNHSLPLDYCTFVLPVLLVIILPLFHRLLHSPFSHHPLFFYYLVCEAIGNAATPGLLCQPRVIVKMIVEKQTECRLAGETEVL
jgi:hypothetical protein